MKIRIERCIPEVVERVGSPSRIINIALIESLNTLQDASLYLLANGERWVGEAVQDTRKRQESQS